ncbi:hypothetical protein [Tepidimonas charontis]|uniref:Uncharacterized protein n=1 Tax=Tepidimonas charontis TaxID=2267262 RepID=A0A554XB13_9BURK|nr:hypothetical protein [Tepidimonas charontis]TSE33027.1 hypothetical protein Tchar_01908 [Tepidimonas charontis]
MSLLASSRPAAAQTVAVYTVPTQRRATININCCNVGASSARVRLAVSADATPADAQWIEWDAALDPSGVLERTGIVLSAGQKLFARSDTGAVNVAVWGIEEIA